MQRATPTQTPAPQRPTSIHRRRPAVSNAAKSAPPSSEQGDDLKPADQINLERIGTSGTEIISGFIVDDPVPEFSTPYQRYLIYDRMRRSDSTIATLLRALELPLKRAKYAVEPASQEPEDLEAAEFLEHCLFEASSKPWVHFIGEVVRVFQFGNTAFEEVHKIEDWEYTPQADEDGDDKAPAQDRPGMIKWDRFAFLNPKTIRRWFISPQDRVIGIEQMGYYQDGAESWYEPSVVIDGDFLLLFALDQMGNNFEGTSILRAAWRDYKALESLQKIELRGCERMAIGVPMINEPEGVTDEERDAAKAIIRGYGAGEEPGLVMPPGWVAQIIDGKMNEHLVKDAIEFHRVQIFMLGLVQFLTHGTGGQGGNRAMSGSQIDLFTQLLTATGEYAAETISAKGRKLLELNYSGLKRFPKVKLVQLVDKDVKGAIDSINACLQAGSIPQYTALANHVADLLDAPPIPKDMVIAETQAPAAEPGKDPQATAAAQKDEQQAAGLSAGTSGRRREGGTSAGADGTISLSAVKPNDAAHWDRVKKQMDGKMDAFTTAANEILSRQRAAVAPELERALSTKDVHRLGQIRLPLQGEYERLLERHLVDIADMGLSQVVGELGHGRTTIPQTSRTAVESWAAARATLLAEKHESDFRDAVIGDLMGQIAEESLKDDSAAKLSAAWGAQASAAASTRTLAAARALL